MPTAPVLIVAAFEPELAPLRARAADASLAAIGIGVVSAGVGLAARLAVARPRVVVLVGTCGAYATSGLALHDVVVATRVVLASTAAAEGRAGLPAPMSREHATEPSLAAWFAARGARPVAVATTLAITEDDALADRVALASGAAAEHLEAFAAAEACAAARVRFSAVLAVANRVGGTARDEWRAHHEAAAARACAAVSAWLDAGAPGA